MNTDVEFNLIRAKLAEGTGEFLRLKQQLNEFDNKWKTLMLLLSQ